MATFQVTTADLRALTSELSGLVGELAQAGAIHPDIAAAGHPGVQSSLESFFSEWSDGLEQTKSNLTGLVGRLASAAGGYEATESSVTSGFQA